MVNNSQYDAEANEVARLLPLGPRLGIIGSSSFWGEDSKEICESIGDHLASLEELVIITGGVPGVGETVGRSFFNARQRLSMNPGVYHVLPRGSGGWDYGVTLPAGGSMLERREVLGRLAPVYLAIEGGTGTVHEVEIARAKGSTIVPVGRTGGYSKELFLELPCPDQQVAREWEVLNDREAAPGEIGNSIKCIVANLLRLEV